MSDDDSNELVAKFLKSWPVLDTLEFDNVSIDVTKWDDVYTVMLNFYESSSIDEPPYSGFSLCTQVCGTTLEEVYGKITVLIDCGLFDGIDISAHGSIWDDSGNEIGEISWIDLDREVAVDDTVEVGDLAFKIKGNTTLQ